MIDRSRGRSRSKDGAAMPSRAQTRAAAGNRRYTRTHFSLPPRVFASTTRLSSHARASVNVSTPPTLRRATIDGDSDDDRYRD